MMNFRSGGFQQIPVVVKNLLIINVLVFALQSLFATMEARGVSTFNFDDMFALHYWLSPKFRWWQMFTHMFMHGSLTHIFFNMFALYMFGRILEDVWGPQRFLLFYIICGFGAALCHLSVLGIEFHSLHDVIMNYQQSPTQTGFQHFLSQYHLQSNGIWDGQSSIRSMNQYYYMQLDEATVGASGAIFGLLFAFGYLFPNTELMLLFPPIPIKAKWFVGIYALIELSQGVYNSAGDNIAHFAHLGGMLFAFILLRIWGKNIRNRFY